MFTYIHFPTFIKLIHKPRHVSFYTNYMNSFKLEKKVSHETVSVKSNKTKYLWLPLMLYLTLSCDDDSWECFSLP